MAALSILRSASPTKEIELTSNQTYSFLNNAGILPPLATCSSCTTDSMRVLSNLSRHVKVYDRLHALDVETPRRQVSSKEVVNSTRLAFIECV